MQIPRQIVIGHQAFEAILPQPPRLRMCPAMPLRIAQMDDVTIVAIKKR
jgi:hypothetical protein